MKKMVIVLTFFVYPCLCFSQTQIEKCIILKHFINDRAFNDLFVNLSQIEDTIVIVDSSKIFMECKLKTLKDMPILIIYTNNFNFDPRAGGNFNDWRNKLLIYKVNTYKNAYEVFFFYRFTNAIGKVKYHIKKGKIKKAEYIMSQL